ncbi:MAG: patatin-like phospholipase family protein [Anaerolineales bacterium]|jgi:NTE family protein
MSNTKDSFNAFTSRPKVGLALGGGGARGIAHIGVLRTLEQAGIPVDCLAGTSIGGIIAAGYASGLTPDQLEQETKNTTRLRRMLRLADPGPLDQGLLRGKRLQSFFDERVGHKTFADLRIPLAIVCVDLNARKEAVITEGSLALAVRATISVPGLFMPVNHRGQRLVDGGLLNNVPVSAVRQLGADLVIAVDVEPDPHDPEHARFASRRWMPEGLTSTFATMDEAISLMLSKVQENYLQQFPPDITLRPEIPPGINVIAGYSRVDDLVQSGEQCTSAALPELHSLLAASHGFDRINLPQS